MTYWNRHCSGKGWLVAKKINCWLYTNMDAEKQKKIESLRREIDEINIELDELLKKVKIGPLIKEVLDMKQRVGALEAKFKEFVAAAGKVSVAS